MAEDLDVDEWDMYDALAKMNEENSLTVVRSKKTELPKDALRWRDVVGEFSLYNEYWVSFWVNDTMYDKKFIFPPEMIYESNFKYLEIINKKAIMLQ